MKNFQLPNDSNIIYAETKEGRWALLSKRENGVYSSVFEASKKELVLQSLEVKDEKVIFVTSNSFGKYQLHTMGTSGFHYQVRLETTDSIIPFQPGVYLKKTEHFSQLYSADCMNSDVSDFCLQKAFLGEIKKRQLDSITVTEIGISAIENNSEKFLFHVRLGNEETIWGTASLKTDSLFHVHPFFYSEMTNQLYSVGTHLLLTPEDWVNHVFSLKWANQLNQISYFMTSMEQKNLEKGKQMLLSISK